MQNILRHSALLAAAAFSVAAFNAQAQATRTTPAPGAAAAANTTVTPVGNGVSAVTTPSGTVYLTDEQFSVVYTDMDTNKDGVISRAEYLNYYGATYDAWDTERRGVLPRETVRTRLFEREMRKTDGNPQGNSPLPGVPVKR